MAKLLGRIIGWTINILSVPFVLLFLVLSLPFHFLKAKKRIEASRLFSNYETSLLAKSQRVINMQENGILNPDGDILAVAKTIEESRVDFQLMKNRGSFEANFTEFLMPRLNLIRSTIDDWENVINFFGLE